MTQKQTKNTVIKPYPPVLVIFDLAAIHRNTPYCFIFDAIQILTCFKDGSSVAVTHEM
jgi:hypothetical protein